MIIIWFLKPAPAMKVRLRQDGGHSGLDAVRLLIHGPADEPA
jgi:hypothetical protein